MPTLASLTRSLTLPLNRKHRQRSQTTTTSPDLAPQLTTEPIEYSASNPPPQSRRLNSFRNKSTPTTTGPFNLNFDGLSRSNTTKSVKTPTREPSFVAPPYVAPDSAAPHSDVFGKPLKESLKHASVQISTANSNGELYIWGYIPVVVAKWYASLIVFDS